MYSQSKHESRKKKRQFAGLPSLQTQIFYFGSEAMTPQPSPTHSQHKRPAQDHQENTQFTIATI